MAADPHALPALIREHLAWLAATNYAASTVRTRRASLQRFATWAEAHGLTHPAELTLPVLERYRMTLIHRATAAGHPVSWGVQAQHLIAVRSFLSWCTRQHLVRYNAAQELELPRQPQRLPRAVLSAGEAERVLAMPDLRDPLGLRDRAILETLYSTGMRRMELITLTPPDLDPERGVVLVREGKGRKDRVVPIGERALAWIAKYLLEVRPLLVLPPDRGTLFLTRRGRRLRPNRLTELLHRYVQASGVGKPGSCHLFRHTMATLMLEGGADIRHIQAMLGHAELSTTARYTRVSIARLKAVHERTHPARLTRAPAPSSLAAELAADSPRDGAGAKR
jgi:integrase/recombinase XerD